MRIKRTTLFVLFLLMLPIILIIIYSIFDGHNPYYYLTTRNEITNFQSFISFITFFMSIIYGLIIIICIGAFIIKTYNRLEKLDALQKAEENNKK